MINLLHALAFLIETLFGIYILLLMLRFLLQLTGAGFRNSPAQFILQMTNPVLQLLTFIPRWRNVDVAALVLMWVLEIVEMVLLLLLYGQLINPLSLLLFSVIKLVRLVLYIFVFTIIMQVILSWIAPHDSYHPLNDFLYYLNKPLLQPVRRLIPPIQGFDLSPLIVLIALQVMIILLSY